MAKKNQSNNLNELLQGCMPSLKGKAQAFLGKDAQHLCDDAISDTLFVAFDTFPKFVPGKKFATSEDPVKEAFSAWISKILKNKCLDKIRSVNTGKCDEGRSKTKRKTLGRRIKLNIGQDIEDVVDAEKWLGDDYTGAVHNRIDGYPETDPADIPSIEDFLKWQEEVDSDEVSIFIEDEPGGCMAFYVRGEAYGLTRFRWDGPHEPPDITLLKLLAKGTPRKTIAKKFPGKNIDTAISRMKKKMMYV